MTSFLLQPLTQAVTNLLALPIVDFYLVLDLVSNITFNIRFNIRLVLDLLLDIRIWK